MFDDQTGLRRRRRQAEQSARIRRRDEEKARRRARRAARRINLNNAIYTQVRPTSPQSRLSPSTQLTGYPTPGTGPGTMLISPTLSDISFHTAPSPILPLRLPIGVPRVAVPLEWERPQQRLDATDIDAYPEDNGSMRNFPTGTLGSELALDSSRQLVSDARDMWEPLRAASNASNVRLNDEPYKTILWSLLQRFATLHRLFSIHASQNLIDGADWISQLFEAQGYFNEEQAPDSSMWAYFERRAEAASNLEPAMPQHPPTPQSLARPTTESSTAEPNLDVLLYRAWNLYEHYVLVHEETNRLRQRIPHLRNQISIWQASFNGSAMASRPQWVGAFNFQSAAWDPALATNAEARSQLDHYERELAEAILELHRLTASEERRKNRFDDKEYEFQEHPVGSLAEMEAKLSRLSANLQVGIGQYRELYRQLENRRSELDEMLRPENVVVRPGSRASVADNMRRGTIDLHASLRRTREEECANLRSRRKECFWRLCQAAANEFDETSSESDDAQ